MNVQSLSHPFPHPPAGTICRRNLRIGTAVLLLGLWAGEFSVCHADLVIHGILVTHSGTVVDTLVSTLQVRGPLLSRCLEGQGMLADFFGHRMELINRATGETTVLDQDLLTYSRAKTKSTLCHPWLVMDLRWLGRTQGGVKGELVFPDTTATILGASARPVDFRFPALKAGGSTIRIWAVQQLDSLFGDDGVRALYCGGPSATANALLAAQLAAQFGLSKDAEGRLREAAIGYPARIETFVGQGKARKELSRFETLRVERTELADSIFTIPKAYAPAEAGE